WRQSFVDSAWVDPPSVCCGAFSDATLCSRLCDVPNPATTGLTEDRLGIGVGVALIRAGNNRRYFSCRCRSSGSMAAPARTALRIVSRQTAVDRATAAKAFGGEMGTSGSAARHGFWLHSLAGGAVAIALALAPQLASADEV